MTRRITSLLTVALLSCCLGLSACGQASTPAAQSDATPTESEPSPQAHEDASDVEQASMLAALWETIDAKVGVHMIYEESNESLGSVAVVDAQGQGASYYSKKTLKVQGIEDTTITVMLDGVAMNLYEETMTGVVATTTSSSVFKDAMMMDSVYQEMWKCAQQSPTSIEQGEMDGVTYTVETYVQQYNADDAFYFDGEGNLAYYVRGAMSASNTEIGESVFKILAIDTDVDESLFDVSDYAMAP